MNNNKNQTKLRCVNPTNINLVGRKDYYGRMFRVKNGVLSPTSSYKNATFFSTTNENGHPIRCHVLRFIPA